MIIINYLFTIYCKPKKYFLFEFFKLIFVLQKNRDTFVKFVLHTKNLHLVSFKSSCKIVVILLLFRFSHFICNVISMKRINENTSQLNFTEKTLASEYIIITVYKLLRFSKKLFSLTEVYKIVIICLNYLSLYLYGVCWKNHS